MKLLCAVLAVWALIGCSMGDETAAGGEATPGAPAAERVCDIQLQGNQTSDDMVDALIDRMLGCVQRVAQTLKDDIRSADDLQEYRDSFRTACGNFPTISECTADVVSQAEVCLNKSTAFTFQVVRQDFHTVLNVICEDNGQKLSLIILDLGRLNKQSETPSYLEECIDEGTRQIETMDEYDASPVSIAYYKTFKTIKECMARRGDGNTILAFLVDSVFGEIVRQLKCVHPETQLEVLCETFVQ